MIKGLQIVIHGDELSRRIAERISEREAAIAALDARIKRREGDLPCDVSVDDGMTTVPDLEAERQRHRDRVTVLGLVRDHLIANETYALTRADLRLAELTLGEEAAPPEGAEVRCGGDDDSPIVGLKLTIPGSELRELLDRRIERHRRRAEWWRHEETRPPEDETEERPRLPSHICENEAERHEWRAKALGFMREHVEAGQVYRVGESDLAFAELLPERPDWLEQDEYEQRTGVAFHLERLERRVGELASSQYTLADVLAASKAPANE